MAILKTDTSFFNDVHDAMADFFVKSTPSFHNLLWQIIVNEAYNDKIICFYPVEAYKGIEASEAAKVFGKWQIGIVAFNEQGYVPTFVNFIPQFDFDDAQAACDILNKQMFGIEQDFMVMLVDRSMHLQEANEQGTI
jgi:hypothetical protein